MGIEKKVSSRKAYRYTLIGNEANIGSGSVAISKGSIVKNEAELTKFEFKDEGKINPEFVIVPYCSSTRTLWLGQPYDGRESEEWEDYKAIVANAKVDPDGHLWRRLESSGVMTPGSNEIYLIFYIENGRPRLCVEAMLDCKLLLPWLLNAAWITDRHCVIDRYDGCGPEFEVNYPAFDDVDAIKLNIWMEMAGHKYIVPLLGAYRNADRSRILFRWNGAERLFRNFKKWTGP